MPITVKTPEQVESLRVYQREWKRKKRASNPDSVRLYYRNYYRLNGAHIRGLNRGKHRKRRVQDPEIVRAGARLYREANREAINATARRAYHRRKMGTVWALRYLLKSHPLSRGETHG